MEHKTTAEQPIAPKERLAICLYRLSRGDYYYTIAEMTGHGLLTIQNITNEVCSVTVSNLWHKFVIFPESEDQILRVIFKMESMWQFPGAFGGTDGCHIPIKFSHGGNEARKEYYNLKNFYYIVMMGIVAADYRFLWANAGLPGSVNDGCTFQASHLYSDIVRGNALPDIKKVLTVQSQREVQLPPILLGDSTFPHNSWLQKPFANTGLSEKQSHFNYCLSRARMVTECTFGQLKGRWRLLYLSK